ncbi:MAG: hypothetical protein HY841_03575 [Bacteroidetes bacterium]|nr:hypothetical protein [Bacteroidota bacterium]
MAITKFEKFIEKNYPGLNFISITNDNYVPGVILNDDDRIIDGLSRIFSAEPATKWAAATVNADIAGGEVQGERDLDSGGSVLGIVSLKAGVAVNYSVSFTFDKVTEMVFDTAKGAVYENEVREMIMKLKGNNRPRWKEILHEYVVMESVYVESATVEFKRNGKVLGQADIEQLTNEVNIDAKYKWNTKGKMEIKNNTSPFGVRGFLIKRFM